METLSWLYHNFIFVVCFVFGGIAILLVWLAVHMLFETVKKKAKYLAFGLFVAFLVVSPFLATAFKNWGKDAYHVAINTPQVRETQEEVDKKWAGLGYGVYVGNWILWGLAILLSVLSFLPNKEDENNEEEGDENGDSPKDQLESSDSSP